MMDTGTPYSLTTSHMYFLAISTMVSPMRKEMKCVALVSWSATTQLNRYFSDSMVIPPRSPLLCVPTFTLAILFVSSILLVLHVQFSPIDTVDISLQILPHPSSFPSSRSHVSKCGTFSYWMYVIPGVVSGFQDFNHKFPYWRYPQPTS